MESREQKNPLATSTILWVEGGASSALLIAAGVLFCVSKAAAVPVAVAAFVVDASIPVTLGLLWHDPRTSGGVRQFATLLAVLQPVGLVIRVAFKYVGVTTARDVAIGATSYGVMWLLYLIGRAVRHLLGDSPAASS